MSKFIRLEGVYYNTEHIVSVTFRNKITYYIKAEGYKKEVKECEFNVLLGYAKRQDTKGLSGHAISEINRIEDEIKRKLTTEDFDVYVDDDVFIFNMELDTKKVIEKIYDSTLNTALHEKILECVAKLECV